jgi:glycosyltransferase involved in cell wall biosynthesis
MSNKVTIFRDFCEDRRISMEVYADGLSQGMRAHFPERCQVREYRPHVPAWLGQGTWRMRLSRFGVYPWQARRQQGQINHIVDHGYGHLLYVLDPERTVVTVHDLIPLVRWCGGIPGLSRGRKPWLNLISFNALRQARHLIAVSENTRRDLIRFCNCAPSKISVIHSGIDPIFKPCSAADKVRMRSALGLSHSQTCLVLMMGSQIYKNQSGALRAFVHLRAIHSGSLQLLKTGMPNPEWSQTVEQLGLAGNVRCLGVVPRAQLPDLYNAADCLLSPSWYEGFGWPPLEAMACGTPVVASNAGSLPEVIGNAGLMCDPKDEPGIAEATYGVLTNTQLRQDLIERGLKRASQFTWEKAARKTLDVYERFV